MTKVIQELERGADISIINLVNYLIEDAHSVHASDMHIDPTDTVVRVRFRMDGVLQDRYNLPKLIHQEIISRIKILTGLRTDEHQAAQDGRFRVLTEGLGNVDIRVSIVPTYYGENAVLRLLADEAEQFSLEALGFNKIDAQKILRVIRRPHGMVLATGPTGSGKTTTLYTLVKFLNTNDTSIITLEDPIEYAITGIKQIQVNQHSGLTFANGLRSVLRQDPNIIMVGEIRDSDTANIAVNTALTGHLLLSTIHTNDAATTIPRLLDMGVESYLAASTIHASIGQRLVRKICENCKEEKNISKAEYASMGETVPKHILDIYKKSYRGKGCSECAQSGYKRRICINEVLLVDDDIRQAILHKASANEIHRIAIENGMTPMIEDGFRKVAEGITTVEEILRVIHE